MKQLFAITALIILTACCCPVKRGPPLVLRYYPDSVVSEPGAGFGVIGLRTYVLPAHWTYEVAR